MAFYTYIMASGPYGTLYVGSTDSLRRRTYQHREGMRPGFTKSYGVTKLVWFENHDTREGAKARERRIKEWKRRWKIELIESMNPRWEDLGEQLNDLLAF